MNVWEALEYCVARLRFRSELRQVVCMVDASTTVVATRATRFQRRQIRETYLVTVGKPNYINRQRLASLRRKKEPFGAPLEYPWPTKEKVMAQRNKPPSRTPKKPQPVKRKRY